MRQVYENYTPEDQQVWHLLSEAQAETLPLAASSAYLSGIKHVGFSTDRIASFDETNEILAQMTGWQVGVVPGLVPPYTFFELMAHRHFPATTWLRKLKELDYLPEPDMFHDVYAHVPLLTNQSFADFLAALSEIAMAYAHDEEAIEYLSRVYWFSVEFGLIRERGELKIYGAGILSSPGETEFSLSGKTPYYDYDPEVMMEVPFKKDVYQDRYFIIDSYAQLYDSIDAIKRGIARRVADRDTISA